MRTFRSHRSDGFDKLAIESDALVVLGGHSDEVGDARLEAGDLADRGACRQTGDMRPDLLMGVSPLDDVARHRTTTVRRRTRPFDRHRIVGDADQTH